MKKKENKLNKIRLDILNVAKKQVILNGWNDKPPKWNFYKYLIDYDGNLKKVLASSINPRDELILDFIKSTYSE